MRHHYIDGGKVRDGVLSDRDSIWGSLMGGVIAVLVSEVGEGVVAEFRLVGGSVDLYHRNVSLAIAHVELRSMRERTRSFAPFFSVNECTPSSRYVTPAALAFAPVHISLACTGTCGSGCFNICMYCPFLA
jgi:hypothetical protein